MSTILNLKLAAAGALAITAVMLPAFESAARDRTAVTFEFSAENDKQQKEQKQQQKVQQRQDTHQQKQQVQQQKQQFEQQKQQQKVQRRQDVHQEKNQTRELKRQGEQQKQQQKILRRDEVHQEKQLRREEKRVFNGGPNAKVVTGARIRGLPGSGPGRFALRGQNYSAWRGGYRHRRGDGRWETFVALGALGVLAIGAYEFYPYAYIEAPRPFCEGLTEDGCQLDWRDVPTVEGDLVGQCVAYCPWQ